MLKALVVQEETLRLLLLHKENLLVNFFAPWCAPCKKMSPLIDEIAEKYQDTLKVCTVNVQGCKEIAAAYNVISIPTLVYFKKGKPVKRVTSSCTKEEIIKTIKEIY